MSTFQDSSAVIGAMLENKVMERVLELGSFELREEAADDKEAVGPAVERFLRLESEPARVRSASCPAKLRRGNVRQICDNDARGKLRRNFGEEITL